eukprot:scaffold3780_cov101-Isochrysis_galbana.AAC.5
MGEERHASALSALPSWAGGGGRALRGYELARAWRRPLVALSLRSHTSKKSWCPSYFWPCW